MSAIGTADWTTQAACATADPDLFFPEPGASAERIREAKEICSSCPVKQACLEDAMRRGEEQAICGGLTANERQELSGSPRGRRPGKTSGRQLAVKHGAYLLTSLVQWRKSVDQVAAELGSTRVAVYCAYLMLVPARPGRTRNKRPSAIEEMLATKKECLKTLDRRGLSHTDISLMLETSQSMVSACLAVLRQREAAVIELSRDGRDGLQRLQDEELRVRLEAGVALTVQDVIEIAGPAIWRMHGQGQGLRSVALELGLNREAVRKAYHEMTSSRGSRALTQNELGAAA
jgi:WhiB family redox-sensing transcriptional regulator